MRKLFFNNFNCHNGDLHYFKQFIRDIIERTDFDEYYLLENKSSYRIFLDVPKLKFDVINNNCFPEQTFYKINNDVYINIHFIRTYNIYEYVLSSIDVINYQSLIEAYYKYYSFIYNKLGIIIQNEIFYIPEIDYSKFDIENINNYVNESDKFKILICNGDALSLQSSNNINFTNLADKLSTLYPNIDFILTEKIDIERSNILFTENIIKSEYPDVNEISYLSTFCDIIIGKASGPYCFTLTKNNLDDVNKTHIAICNAYMYGFYTRFSKSDRIWINNYDESNIFDIINDQIQIKYHSFLNVRNIQNLKITRDGNRIDFVSSENLYNIQVISYTSINDDGIFIRTYGTHFEYIAKDVSYFIYIDILCNEKTKFKLQILDVNEKIHEFII